MAAVDLVIVVLAGLIPIMAASIYYLADRTATVGASQPTRKLVGVGQRDDRNAVLSTVPEQNRVETQASAAKRGPETKQDPETQPTERRAGSDIHVMAVDPQAPTVRIDRAQAQRA